MNYILLISTLSYFIIPCISEQKPTQVCKVGDLSILYHLQSPSVTAASSQHGASLKIKALGIGSNVKQYSLYTTAVAALLWEKMQEPMRLKWTKQTKTFIIKYSKN